MGTPWGQAQPGMSDGEGWRTSPCSWGQNLTAQLDQTDPGGEPGSGPSLPTTFHALWLGSRDTALPSQVLTGLSPFPGCVPPRVQGWTQLPHVRPGVAPEAVKPSRAQVMDQRC